MGTKTSETVHDEATKLVKEMFPDFGNGFVERIVEFYEGKTEDIINALLENNLHPEIAALDRNMLSKAELEQKKKKNIIPGLYHKKAKPIAEDEMGRRKDQIFVNAIAKQYAYVDEVVEVKVPDDGATEHVEDTEQEITDEFGARFKMNAWYEDEYDDTYDDVNENVDIDPLALNIARERVRKDERYGRTELESNPNLKHLEDETTESDQIPSDQILLFHPLHISNSDLIQVLFDHIAHLCGH